MASRFLRVSNQYGFAGGSSVRLARYALARTGGVPAASPEDSLEAAKSRLSKLLERQLTEGDEAELDPELVPGDLLARIWSLFGPPVDGKSEERFYYTFLDTATRQVFTISSWEGGAPQYGLAGRYEGPLPPPADPDATFRPDASAASSMPWQQTPAHSEAEKQLRVTANAFEDLTDAAPLADCALIVDTDEGLHRIGARAGKVVHEELSFGHAVDFYVALIGRHGASRDIPIYYLAEPQQKLRWLWSSATEEQRAQRPGAVVYAQKAWLTDLRELSESVVLDENDQHFWRTKCSSLDRDAALVGASPEARAELEGLREPPALPTLSAVELQTLKAALWVKSASPHWSDEDRKQREVDDKERAEQNAEEDPARIVRRLAVSVNEADRNAASRLEKALLGSAEPSPQ